MKKIQVTLTEEQLRVVTEALDDYGRMCCMQFDNSSTWRRIQEVVKHQFKGILCADGADLCRDEIQRIQRHYTRGYGASWCASPFVKELYHIQKSLTPVLCVEAKKNDPNHSCTRCDGTLLTRDNHDFIDVKVVEE